MDIQQWLDAHGAAGIVNAEEVPDLQRAAGRVLALMIDLQWHPAHAIRLAAGGGEFEASEGLRRMRDLRPFLARIGSKIEKQRAGESSRLFVYRITKPKPQGMLF